MHVYVNGQKVNLSPQQAIGKGGEADVFDIGNGQVLKLYKPPDHPDYRGMPQEQAAARSRLTLMQHKLPQFPQALPDRVVSPIDLAMDQGGQSSRQIVGYTMERVVGATPLVKYGDRGFPVPRQAVVTLFQDLHQTVTQLHQAGVIIGDFNDLNILVVDQKAYLIDADSFQFGAFPCGVFTARFVDPLLCDPQASYPMLAKPYTPEADWYTFTVMLMQCLLFVHPYGGVFKPTEPTQRVPHSARPLHRISVFHHQVKYPKPALPYQVLPDDWLHQFQQVFEGDQRGLFPMALLKTLRWRDCQTCGLTHGRSQCPQCSATLTLPLPARPVGVAAPSMQRGTVTITPVFATAGNILQAVISQGKLCWLYWHEDRYCRETNAMVLAGTLSGRLGWRISGNRTFLAYQDQVVTLPAKDSADRIAVDSVGTEVCFAVNDHGRYWVNNSQLQRDGTLGPKVIGDVLSRQTRFWVGETFGVGFYRAGNLQGAFVFDTQRLGLNDRVKLPLMAGTLIDIQVSFGSTLAWIFWTTQFQGQRYCTCTVIQSTGAILATETATLTDDHWLAQKGRGGGCATGQSLLLATDHGIIRIERQHDRLVHSQSFPDTEPYCDRDCQLLPAPGGLYVVSDRTIRQLTLA